MACILLLASLFFATKLAADNGYGAGGCNCTAECGPHVAHQCHKIVQLEAEVRAIQGGARTTRRTSVMEAPCGDVWNIASDADMEAYQGCRTTHTLTIRDGVTSLAGLQSLEGAEVVTIRDNPKLKSLAGLEQLSRVGTRLEILNNVRLSSLSGLQGLLGAREIRIEGNSRLQSITDLDGLTSVEDELAIKDCLKLVSLVGLRRLESVGKMTIHGTGLESFTGLIELRTLGELVIEDSLSLVSLEGLQRLESVGKMTIEDTGLESFAELTSLTSLGSELVIINNPRLVSLTGFPSLGNVTMLRIESTGLESLAGLGSFGPAAESLTIKNNNQLVSLAGLHNLESVDALTIYLNRGLESLAGLESLVHVGSLLIGAQHKLKTFAGLHRLETVKEMELQHSTFEDLTGLEGLTRLDTLTVRWCTVHSFSGLGLPTAGTIGIFGSKSNITGFENLVSVESLRIGSCPYLNPSPDSESVTVTSVTGFNSLVNVTYELRLRCLEHASSIVGFQSLQFAQRVEILECSHLRSLRAFNSLVRADAISISSAPLESLAGFVSLTRAGSFSLRNASNLVDLTGLENLAQVDELTLDDMPKLQSIAGLRSLTDASIKVEIHLCPELRSLEGLAALRTKKLRVIHDASTFPARRRRAFPRPLQYMGGPFAAEGASAEEFEIDAVLWPPCVTPHERTALAHKVGKATLVSEETAAWPPWHPDCERPNFGTFSCTRGHSCTFFLAGEESTSVFVSARFGGCGLCSAEARPQSDIEEEDGKVDLGYALKNEEGGLYSICRCANSDSGLLGPVAQLSLRGPRRTDVTVCTRGRNCTVELDGETLQPTDRVVLMSDCSGNPLLGYAASWTAKNVFLLHDPATWLTTAPARYRVCWRAPCSSTADGPTCPAPEDEYLDVGAVDLPGPSPRDYTKVLGHSFGAPNVGHAVSDGDRMRIMLTCGEVDGEGLEALEAKSLDTWFDFGRLMEDRAQPGGYRLCWCQDRTECSAARHFKTDAGSVQILCPAGQEFEVTSRRCQDCPAGRQRLEEGLLPCWECPPGQYSRGGGKACSACGSGSVAERAGSSDCVACEAWQRADVEAAGCSADPVTLGLLASFFLSAGALSGLLVHSIRRRLYVVDVSTENDCVIITTFGSHGLSHFGRSSFPVSFRDTGHPGLDKASKRFRAKVKDAACLELLTWSGASLDSRLDTSMGTLTVNFPHELYHQGWPVPVAFTLLVLLIAVTVLGGQVLGADLKAEGRRGTAASILAFAAVSAAVRWRPRTTPLVRHLLAFKLKLAKRTPTYCEKGAHRALAVGKLYEVLEAFRDLIRDRTAYYLDSNVLRQLTKDKKISYAELAGAGKVEWFVSHFWGTAFEHFCTALQKHAEMACGDRKWDTLHYWVCFCSNNQYKIQEELGAGWEESSFYVTLKSGHCQGTCMVLDDKALPLTRVWCIFELLQTVKLARNDNFQGLLLCTAGGVLNAGNGSAEVAMALAQKVADMDFASAQSSSESDAKMIRQQVIAEMGSFAALHDFVRVEVRSMLVRAQASANQQFAAVLARLEGDAT